MKQVKLVIWDLDNTFWKGTLSEGAIEYDKHNHETVIALAGRGIMSAICSKNNYDDVRQYLVQQGIWDYFVFPKIAWQPKGAMVAELIADMHLRPENVLFIDDNSLNLNEALFYCPGLQTSSPDILAGLLGLDVCTGKPDREMSRLKQYKLLEKKRADRVSAQCDNKDFLRGCRITVQLCHNCQSEFDRILELINRTNQLNYTKNWLTRQELEDLLQDAGAEIGFVRVKDKYGDYGVSGFYVKKNSRLEHFLFSCRIMNMGVENWLYEKLGRPAIDVAGDVAVPLSQDNACDWITEIAANKTTSSVLPRTSYKSLSIMVKGSCDLLHIQHYLLKGSLFDCEVSYLSPAGYRMNVSHTEILKQCNLHTLASYGPIIDKLHFLDRSAFRTNFFSGSHDVYIYSVLDNYTKGLYRYRNSDFTIAFGDYTYDLTDPAVWDYHAERSPKHRIPKGFLEWFKDNFVFMGPLDSDGFRQNMAWLCDQIDSDRLLIILNGSEVPCGSPSEQDRWLRHREMNHALDEVMALMPHAALCDVRQFAQTRADHPHNIRSYSRKAYFNIAQHINHIIEQRRSVSSGFWQKGLLKCRYLLPVSPKIEKRNAFRFALEKKKTALQQFG